MKRTKEMKKEWIAELKKMQKSYQGEISPDDLPFDLTAELGEVVTVELKSPGVYYIATKKAGDIPECPEVYVVTADAPAISEKAWTYGQEFPGHPDLRVYDILQPKSGRYIIDFEMRRYQIKCHLPEIEDEDSLYTAALYGAEEHPDYFGAFPVPSFTPRGFTVRQILVFQSKTRVSNWSMTVCMGLTIPLVISFSPSRTASSHCMSFPFFTQK